ncbi:hypothetical protein SAMN02799615_00881 [Dyella marensis]|uniref:Uncharacterized protein n=1 Tax=Dyella marensis TaxID=500610 RepID=A0A1I2A3Z3_9GAMM|nr:hypothetical protein SAMN02799615_00881 [Dyella marensis]
MGALGPLGESETTAAARQFTSTFNAAQAAAVGEVATDLHYVDQPRNAFVIKPAFRPIGDGTWKYVGERVFESPRFAANPTPAIRQPLASEYTVAVIETPAGRYANGVCHVFEQRTPRMHGVLPSHEGIR